MADQPVQPDVVEGQDDQQTAVTHPTKLLRIGSMTRALLEEARRAPVDESGREMLRRVYDRTVEDLCEILSENLREELEGLFVELNNEAPSESELRIAQAQLVGWLEGLFHGIQASVASQQMAAQAQLAEMRRQQLTQRQQSQQEKDYPGVYL